MHVLRYKDRDVLVHYGGLYRVALVLYKDGRRKLRLVFIADIVRTIYKAAQGLRIRVADSGCYRTWWRLRHWAG